jgi:hypothetical protein
MSRLDSVCVCRRIPRKCRLQVTLPSSESHVGGTRRHRRGTLVLAERLQRDHDCSDLLVDRLRRDLLVLPIARAPQAEQCERREGGASLGRGLRHAPRRVAGLARLLQTAASGKLAQAPRLHVTGESGSGIVQTNRQFRRSRERRLPAVAVGLLDDDLAVSYSSWPTCRGPRPGCCRPC